MIIAEEQVLSLERRLDDLISGAQSYREGLTRELAQLEAAKVGYSPENFEIKRYFRKIVIA